MSRLLVLAAALLLGACTMVPPAEDGAGPYRGPRADLTTWTATGRVHIQAGDESWQATLYWRQADDAYRIRLIAPLGQGTLELKGDETGVILRTADGEVFEATDPETLMLDTLGWRVPVDGLQHWLVGRVAPGAAVTHRVLDPAGRLAELEQGGWRIRYRDYSEAAGIALPSRLVLETHRFALRLVVSRWEPGRA